MNKGEVSSPWKRKQTTMGKRVCRKNVEKRRENGNNCLPNPSIVSLIKGIKGFGKTKEINDKPHKRNPNRGTGNRLGAGATHMGAPAPVEN